MSPPEAGQLALLMVAKLATMLVYGCGVATYLRVRGTVKSHRGDGGNWSENGEKGSY